VGPGQFRPGRHLSFYPAGLSGDSDEPPEEATVYVVDDDPSVRAGLARLLKSVGLTVKTFASALEFLDQAVC
jgi:response regulator RpfG family c-di-GMP phosphodiesterase